MNQAPTTPERHTSKSIEYFDINDRSKKMGIMRTFLAMIHCSDFTIDDICEYINCENISVACAVQLMKAAYEEDINKANQIITKYYEINYTRTELILNEMNSINN